MCLPDSDFREKEHEQTFFYWTFGIIKIPGSSQRDETRYLTGWCHPSSIIRHQSSVTHTNRKKRYPKWLSRTLPLERHGAEILLSYLFISKSIYSYCQVWKKSKTKKTGVTRHSSSKTIDGWWMMDDGWWMTAHQQDNTSNTCSMG